MHSFVKGNYKINEKKFFKEETASTLKFAARAKRIKTAVKKNEVLSSDRLLKENAALKKRIMELQSALKSKGVEVLARNFYFEIVLSLIPILA